MARIGSTISFGAQLGAMTEKAKRNMLYIASMSTQDVLEGAQTPQPSVKITGGSFEVGKIPVDTADLVNSLTVEGNTGPDAYVVAIAGMKLGDVMEFEWTMPYAARVEFGFVGTDALGREYNQAGRFFVGTNAARFSEFVEKRAAEVEK